MPLYLELGFEIRFIRQQLVRRCNQSLVEVFVGQDVSIESSGVAVSEVTACTLRTGAFPLSQLAGGAGGRAIRPLGPVVCSFKVGIHR